MRKLNRVTPLRDSCQTGAVQLEDISEGFSSRGVVDLYLMGLQRSITFQYVTK
jgi:hypothetical protein